MAEGDRSSLVYPYFNDDRSIFKFPPLGLGYIASYAMEHGYTVSIVDCTFMDREETIARVRSLKPRVIGIYSMVTMKERAIYMAKRLKEHCDLMVAPLRYPRGLPERLRPSSDGGGQGHGEGDP